MRMPAREDTVQKVFGALGDLDTKLEPSSRVLLIKGFSYLLSSNLDHSMRLSARTEHRHILECAKFSATASQS